MVLNGINWAGQVEVNGTVYATLQDAIASCGSNHIEEVKLLHNKRSIVDDKPKETDIDQIGDDTVYVVTVKGYMTKPSQPGFDFMTKWNNDKPMPLRTMVGTVEKETKGMVYVKLHGDIIAHTVPICMKCGKPLTNPVSQFFGMGPECGGHNYVNPFDTEEELRAAVAHYRTEVLQKITWEGWIIKSAIVTQEVYNEEA